MKLYGIVGQGFVGKAVHSKFKIFTIFCYDIKDLCNSSLKLKKLQ